MNLSTPSLLLLAATSLLAPDHSRVLAQELKPNFVFVITDDQGYGDVSRHGNPILRTPHLDRLHDRSVRFTDFMVSPTCAPTRAALMTGRHEFKNGVTHTIAERERLRLDAVTLPQVLQEGGYTTGIFGKWHLGDEPEYQPGRRGFDEVFIHGAGGIGQTYPGSCGDAPGNTYLNPAILHNGRFVRTKGYCTDIFFEQALRWIEKVRDRPFYAHVALNAPHAPLQVPPAWEALYTGRVTTNEAKFFGMVANIDFNLGRLLDQLGEWDLARRTVVVFMSDNGGTVGTSIFNAGMRGQKGTPWMGGIRANSYWSWPGVWQPADVAALTAHIDFFPTLAELAGIPLKGRVREQVEGRSLVRLLRDPRAEWTDRTLVTHVGRWEHGKASESKYLNCSIRNENWQMVSVARDGRKAWQLFDLRSDPGTARNVIAEQPQVGQELEAAYDRWWEAVQSGLVNESAVGPEVNPFKALYWKQYGGGPDEEIRRQMDPTRRPGSRVFPAGPRTMNR